MPSPTRFPTLAESTPTGLVTSGNERMERGPVSAVGGTLSIADEGAVPDGESGRGADSAKSELAENAGISAPRRAMGV